MPIRFVCPNGDSLTVSDDRAGRRGRCPYCRVRLRVPDANVDGPRSANVARSLEAPHTHDPHSDDVELPDLSEMLDAELAVARVRRESLESPVVAELVADSDEGASAAIPVGMEPHFRLGRKWALWRPGSRLTRVCQPAEARVSAARMLAASFALLGVANAVLAFSPLVWPDAKLWAVTLLAVAAMSAFYAAWLALLSDVSVVRVGLAICGVTILPLLVAATLAAASRDDSTFWHGLGSVRRLTFGAATINSLFLSLIAFGLWQLASTWPHGERLSRHARLSSSRRG